MKKLLFFLTCSLTIVISSAQTPTENQYKNLQILERELATAKTTRDKTNALISLYFYHSAHPEPFNKIAAKDYQQKLEIYTHSTGEPDLIATALLTSTFFISGDLLKRRIALLYEYSKLHNLEFFMARTKIREAAYVHLSHSDLIKSNQLLNDALNISKDLNDSLRTIILLQASSRYNSMNNHLQSLQLAFQAHELASQLKSLRLQQSTNNLIEEIYRSLRNYGKALEYGTKNLQMLRLINLPHMRALKHAHVASSYFRLDLPVLGHYHMNEAFRVADSIKGSKRLYNEITGFIVAALTFSTHNEVLADFLKRYRQHFFILPANEFLDYVTLARAFAKTGQMDSAKALITKAANFLKTNERPDVIRRYHYTLARISVHDKDWNGATESYKKAIQVALTQNNLTDGIEYTDSLIGILEQQNRLAEAVQYYKLSDSLQKEVAIQLDKEDLTRQEVAALEKEKQLQAIEIEREKNQRHNLQYLGITAGVVSLFILLLIMGLFKVSPRMIKVLSFFAFLLFFEFVFLLFKKKIYVLTYGEPWKDLAFMVLLAAVMVPLHHWGEHKAVEYLSNRKLSARTFKLWRNRVALKEEVVD